MNLRERIERAEDFRDAVADDEREPRIGFLAVLSAPRQRPADEVVTIEVMTVERWEEDDDE